MEARVDKNKDATLQAFDRLLKIMDELRTQCPWDRQQTIESLRHLTIEETYELSEAILAADMQNVKKELGDLLLHIVFHARIAAEQKAFTLTEVIQALCEKLIDRHPHIYAQAKAQDAQEVAQQWEEIKLKEKGNSSVLGGVPASLPSLIKAMRMQEKALRIGVGQQGAQETFKKVQEKMQVLAQADIQQASDKISSQTLQETLGALLFELVSYARFIKLDPEAALEKANQKFKERVQRMEQQITEEGQHLPQLSPEEVNKYWEQAAS
ncbi:MAG: nucleoside triphosphate pyrophosphohydrolase [Roseivirga sp.]